jgi:hypothetical protein
MCAIVRVNHLKLWRWSPQWSPHSLLGTNKNLPWNKEKSGTVLMPWCTTESHHYVYHGMPHWISPEAASSPSPTKVERYFGYFVRFLIHFPDNSLITIHFVQLMEKGDFPSHQRKSWHSRQLWWVDTTRAPVLNILDSRHICMCNCPPEFTFQAVTLIHACWQAQNHCT